MGYSNWDDDQADIDAVVHHFERQGFQVYALIGHSRGKFESSTNVSVGNIYAQKKERRAKGMLRNPTEMTLHFSRMIPSRPCLSVFPSFVVLFT